ncbi:hypothetical protein E2562_029670 [Oryza meyeriana var. granulata]|uniref:Uncharacterized protein n=1 Tax=Oryza meyeriana var. granulata TaxID=110450 RepID=A0A6G1BZI7_9ORYZ|nr:hypothetical protein E2562_029670 [Oryza meyeriana var. granulata]
MAHGGEEGLPFVARLSWRVLAAELARVLEGTELVAIASHIHASMVDAEEDAAKRLMDTPKKTRNFEVGDVNLGRSAALTQQV